MSKKRDYSLPMPGLKLPAGDSSGAVAESFDTGKPETGKRQAAPGEGVKVPLVGTVDSQSGAVTISQAEFDLFKRLKKETRERRTRKHPFIMQQSLHDWMKHEAESFKISLNDYLHLTFEALKEDSALTKSIYSKLKDKIDARTGG